jgi:hypothetical protein
MQSLSLHLTQLLLEIYTLTTVDYTGVLEEFQKNVLRKPLNPKAQKKALTEVMSQRLPQVLIELILPSQNLPTLAVQAKIIVGLACMRRHAIGKIYTPNWSVSRSSTVRLRKLIRLYIRSFSRDAS